MTGTQPRPLRYCGRLNRRGRAWLKSMRKSLRLTAASRRGRIVEWSDWLANSFARLGVAAQDAKDVLARMDIFAVDESRAGGTR